MRFLVSLFLLFSLFLFSVNGQYLSRMEELMALDDFEAAHAPAASTLPVYAETPSLSKLAKYGMMGSGLGLSQQQAMLASDLPLTGSSLMAQPVLGADQAAVTRGGFGGFGGFGRGGFGGFGGFGRGFGGFGGFGRGLGFGLGAGLGLGLGAGLGGYGYGGYGYPGYGYGGMYGGYPYGGMYGGYGYF